jgi:TDG/mug DNA glycosylase family protein
MASESAVVRKSGFSPVVDNNTEILILGTMPSDTSLARGQYYANPSNDFWELIGAALNKNMECLPYEDRIEIIQAHRIGLWDAYHTCLRPGSMDRDITEQELNDFSTLRNIAPKLRLICFNGKRAAQAEQLLLGFGYQTRHLPSSSAANRKDQAGRIQCWKMAIGFPVSSVEQESR